MDPVSVFTALYDTRCISFTAQEADASATTCAPYQVDLRPMSLQPKLMDSIVSQVAQKYLSRRSISILSRTSIKSPSSSLKKLLGHDEVVSSSEESDADSHLGEELEAISGDEDSDWEKVDHELEPIVCAAGGARPLAAAAAFKAQLPILGETVDKLGQLVEQAAGGAVPKQELKRRVILVQDVIKSGELTLETIRRIEEGQRFKVQFVICIVDCDENGADRVEREAGTRVVSLYNMGAILRILEITGRITGEQYGRARQWIAAFQQDDVMVPEPKQHTCGIDIIGTRISSATATATTTTTTTATKESTESTTEPAPVNDWFSGRRICC